MKTKMIGTFKATNKNPNDYKSTNRFINELWKKNEKKLKEVGLTKDKFASRIKNIMAEGHSRKEAAYAYSRTRLFLSRDEIGLQNIKEHLGRQEAADIRKASGNYKEKIHWEKYTYDKNKKGYVYQDGSHMLVYNPGEDSESESFISVVTLI